MIGRLLARLRRFYHDWWVADDEESRSLDEREQAARQRASITYYESRRTKR